MGKTATLWLALLTASLTTSCATRPSPVSCPAWVAPSPALVGQLDDRAFKEWAARHNRNYRCFCLGERDFCAK